MRTEAVRHRLDQRGSITSQGAGAGPLRGVVHGEWVVAVDLLTDDAVADGAVGDRAPGLLAHVGRDGPLVVLAHEDHRDLADAGEVHGLVEVALRARSVTEVADGDRLLALQLHAPRDTDRMRKVGGQGDLLREQPMRRGQCRPDRMPLAL